MKLHKIILTALVTMSLVYGINAQDNRTVETRVADLLAQLPSDNTAYTEKLMTVMATLGEPGIRLICAQIVPPGTGDDTHARFAVESFSRFLSQKDREAERASWEKICIGFATDQKDKNVKDFFMKQLQQVGSEATVEALKGFLSDKEMCGPALAAILAVGGKHAEEALAASLKDPSLPCAAAVMNGLAAMKSGLAVNEYITWSADINVNTKASAFNAMAQSASPVVGPILLKAARSVGYRWEHSGATTALLGYASNVAANGDLKTMDKICREVISKCNDRLTIQNKIKALEIYTAFHGEGAMKELIKATGNPDKSCRNAALQASLGIPGKGVVDRWISFFPKARPEARPEIITMLGQRGDKDALPLVRSSLSDPDPQVRLEAAPVLGKLEGKKAVPDLIAYLGKFTGKSDQDAAKAALMSVSGTEEITLLKPLLKDGDPASSASAIDLMAWSRNHELFGDVLTCTSSADETVKTSAFRALQSLAEPADQGKLLELLTSVDREPWLSDIQEALATAALKISDKEKRSDEMLKALHKGIGFGKLLPALSKTGGKAALDEVMKEFGNGNPDTRDLCFKALTSWPDFSAASKLYEICASGNKTFEAPAFDGFVNEVRDASLTGERKLLLYRKIMAFALDPERKNRILEEVGKIRTYPALFFAAGFLDNPETSAAAASASMFIALPSADLNAGMYGTIVRKTLEKAMDKLAGPEKEYNREMISKYLASMPEDEGFKPMFNGTDLSGWQGLVENPVARAKMKGTELERKQAEANVLVPASWSVKDGCIWFNGKGDNLCSIAEYGDFEMLVDWKITRDGDSGIYLRGSPQVQIWDTSRTDVGAQVGSGGLYNNAVNPSKPLKVADNPIGDWNSFRIVMTGEKVSVWLNGDLVVDNVVMENYWDRKIPIFPKGPIELQAHGTDLAFRDIYVREISDKDFDLTQDEKSEGFVALFNGRNLDNWTGNKKSYVAEDGMIVIKPEDGGGGNLYTEKEFEDFIFRFEFQLTPAANNGIGIRAPLEGDAAYVGMEIQVLDNTAPVYANLQPYQYHGSVYGVIPAKRGYLKPVGEWNSEEIKAVGTHITVTLNGTVIVDGDIAGPRDNGTMDHNDHPGLRNKTGHIGFLGHGSIVKFRKIRIKDLSEQ